MQKKVGKCTTEEDVGSTHPCSCQVFPSTNDLLVGLHLAGRLPSCLQAGANRKWIEIVTESTRLTIDVYIYPCLPFRRTWFFKPDELLESALKYIGDCGEFAASRFRDNGCRHMMSCMAVTSAASQ